MVPGERRGVTRGYAVGLIGAVTLLAFALLVAGWGAIALATGTQPVQTDSVPFVAAPLAVGLSLALLGGMLWTSTVTLLRGTRTPPLAQSVVAACGAYLLWCLVGMLAGMSIGETWLSWYSVVLAVFWALAPLILWAVLTRRVYSDRRPPRWYWENHPAPGDLQYPDQPVDPEGGPRGP
ncbi:MULTISPECIES: hypothetical protein [unclassified Leucobacter]|uniref:hypothetical protein n=1 Tax=unclassified Leucobacter TaxID=2621730 RepID=UPI00165E6C54|nr:MULTISPECIES: hypothetical protein [unclassified Leucobacter]MBC9937349.1 hypothetical protein [Leucobacter sp. cx-87]